jgi:hypothetical protein
LEITNHYHGFSILKLESNFNPKLDSFSSITYCHPSSNYMHVHWGGILWIATMAIRYKIWYPRNNAMFCRIFLILLDLNPPFTLGQLPIKGGPFLLFFTFHFPYLFLLLKFQKLVTCLFFVQTKWRAVLAKQRLKNWPKYKES